MYQKDKEKIISLDQIYKEIIADCGKNPPKELLQQEFLYALRDIGEQFLRKRLK